MEAKKASIIFLVVSQEMNPNFSVLEFTKHHHPVFLKIMITLLWTELLRPYYYYHLHFRNNETEREVKILGGLRNFNQKLTILHSVHLM